MPRPRTDTIRFLTLDELGRLLAATRGSVRDRALFLLAYRHGLRASEVGLLRVEDLDLRTLRLMVHRLKGSHSGAHLLQPDEAKAIGAWLRECPQPPSSVLFRAIAATRSRGAKNVSFAVRPPPPVIAPAAHGL